MPWKLQDQQIFVHRPTLTGIPELSLPSGYSEQPNSDARTEAWVGLLNSVFGGFTVDSVRPQINSNRWNSDRVKLVAKDDELVAISMSWHEPELWPHSGFVFWLAVSERHRGRGLGSFVLTRALKHMAQDGLSDAVTYTLESMLPAVQLYLKLGFRPLLTGTVPEERERWLRTFHRLGRPDLISTVRDDYDRIAKDKRCNSDVAEPRR